MAHVCSPNGEFQFEHKNADYHALPADTVKLICVVSFHFHLIIRFRPLQDAIKC